MKKLSIIFVTALALALTGCSVPSQNAAATKNSKATKPTSSSSSIQSASSASSSTSSEFEILAKLITYTNAQSPGPTKDYYWENGAARLSGFNGMKAGDYHFTSDSQGRSATARAVLTYSEFKDSEGERQGTPLDPPAWPAHNPKVAIGYSLTSKTYHGYLYNRSHSIADSLLGKGSYTSANNFTTGTRSQNVGADQNGGMRAAEEKAENFWKSHINTSVTIEYETTPLYLGDETIPRGSIVDEKSSDGSLNIEIIVINDAEGQTINYNSGADTSISQQAPAVPATQAPSQNGDATSQLTVYVASHGDSKVYWYDENAMPKSTNKANVVTMTEAHAIADGKHHSLTEK